MFLGIGALHKDTSNAALVHICSLCRHWTWSLTARASLWLQRSHNDDHMRHIRMPVIAGPYERNVMECPIILIILQYITSYIIISHLKCLNAGCKMQMYYLLCWFWIFFVYHTQCCVSSPSCAILSSHIPECLPPKYLRLQVLGMFATLQWICAEQAFVHEMRRALNLRKYLHCLCDGGRPCVHTSVASKSSDWFYCFVESDASNKALLCPWLFFLKSLRPRCLQWE